MALTKDEAVVLRRLDYSETSQVLVFFARQSGIVRAIAKGVKRSTKTRFAPAIDLLDVGHLVFSTRSPRQSQLATLTEWKQTHALSGLRERLDRLHAAQYAAEVVAGLTTDWDPHPALFDALVDLLRGLCDAPAVIGLLVAFQRTLLHEVGLLPELDACISCGRAPVPREPLYFSSHEGGLICRDCEAAHVEKRQVRPASLGILRGEGGPEESAAGAFDILNYHISHMMGRAPVTAPLVRVR